MGGCGTHRGGSAGEEGDALHVVGHREGVERPQGVRGCSRGRRRGRRRGRGRPGRRRRRPSAPGRAPASASTTARPSPLRGGSTTTTSGSAGRPPSTFSTRPTRQPTCGRSANAARPSSTAAWDGLDHGDASRRGPPARRARPRRARRRRRGPTPCPPRGAAAHSPTTVGQHVRQRRVHLPEHARREPPLPAHGALDGTGSPSPAWTTPVGVDHHLHLAGREPPREHRRQRAGRRQRAVGDRPARRGCGAHAGLRDPRRRPRGAPGCASPAARPAAPRPRPPWSRPASRCSCSASTCAFHARCAGGSTCCRSQPPQPPARAHEHGAGDPVGRGVRARRRRRPGRTSRPRPRRRPRAPAPPAAHAGRTRPARRGAPRSARRGRPRPPRARGRGRSSPARRVLTVPLTTSPPGCGPQTGAPRSRGGSSRAASRGAAS